MTMTETFLKELEQESLTTRKMLSRVPAEKLDWQPHHKSMTLRSLATHVAELPSWMTLVLSTKELDFAKNPYKPVIINTNGELMDLFESSLKDGCASLVPENNEQMDDVWTIRSGDTIYNASPKSENIHHTLCQIIHHRAQLGVYLRLLDIPIPGSYGPSADEPM